MSNAFTDFLRKKAAIYDVKAKENAAVVDEWRRSILRLFEQVKDWLKESDPDGIIKIKQSDWDVSEPGLGRYKVPRFDLSGFGKWVGLVPKARRTVGTAAPAQKSAPERATGRIDMTDELRRYLLYRLPQGSVDEWCIEDPRSGEQKPLNQQSFEAALMSYFE